MPAITVAAVNGACAGAGFGWACGCDLRVAARSAMFNTAFLNVAVAGDMGLPWSLPRLVGAARARELSFFSEKFSAAEAHRIGLVARVWDDGGFRDEVAKLVARLAGAAPLALKTLKAHYLAAERGGASPTTSISRPTDHLRIVKSADTAEAFRAFLEKRAPGVHRALSRFSPWAPVSLSASPSVRGRDRGRSLRGCSRRAVAPTAGAGAARPRVRAVRRSSRRAVFDGCRRPARRRRPGDGVELIAALYQKERDRLDPAGRGRAGSARLVVVRPRRGRRGEPTLRGAAPAGCVIPASFAAERAPTLIRRGRRSSSIATTRR